MRGGGTVIAEGAIDEVGRVRPPVSRALMLLVGLVLIAGTANLFAQHGAGRGTRSRPFICVYDCREPSGGIDPTDSDLRRFDQLVAVQATAEQGAAFAGAKQDAENAAKQLNSLRQVLEKNPGALEPADASTLSQFLDKACTSNQKFLASFSDPQKSGLKEFITRVTNAASDLGRETVDLNGIIQARQSSTNIASLAGSIDTALASLRSGQLALAREMGILPNDEKDLTFHLPQVTSSADIGGRHLSIPVAGEAIRSSVTNGQSLFDLRLVVDLSDLQDNVAGILRSRLAAAPECGQRIAVQQATLLSQSAESLTVLHLHHERWICPPGVEREGGGQLLVAEGDATVEIKLSPSADSNGDLHLVAKVSHVDADEVFRDSLLTGPLGAKLAGQVGNLVLSTIKKGADLATILPPAAYQAVTIQTARFQAGGADQLRLVLDGQLRFSDEQIKEFAVQLRQQLSAQATPSQ